MAQPRIMFYHDGRHPLIYMYEPPMQPVEYEAAVDELVGTPVEALMFCVGDGRTVLHDTKVGELWGHNMDRWPHLIFRRACQNAQHLIETGHDPLRVVCDRAHAKGMLVYPTLLVQQGRGERGVDVRCSDFRFDNTNLEIGAGGDLPPDFGGATSLDFKHEQVRDERFALIEETLVQYEVDGLALDLAYTPHYFHPDEVEAGRDVMTSWIERVHKAVKARGSQRELAIKIPADLRVCDGIGLDVRGWIERGIVDVLIGEGMGGNDWLDQTVDFRPLVEAADGSSCRVHAALGSFVDSDRLAEGPIQMIRAAACNIWAQGVDGLYIGQWFGQWPYGPEFYEKLREVPHPDIMAARDKIYFIPTQNSRQSGSTDARPLPAPLPVGEPMRVVFDVSDDLERWHDHGCVHEVILRCCVLNVAELDRVDFVFNGQVLPADRLRRINQMYRMRAPRYRVNNAYWYVYRLDRAFWPRQGANALEVTLRERDRDLTPTVELRDVELQIDYLMGRSFHRGIDPDLGPSETLR